jgi:adenine/guanine phosphoribosyltransferase-like PRPP-binding protein
LVEALGGSIVGIGILIELSALGGRAALGDHRLEALASY